MNEFEEDGPTLPDIGKALVVIAVVIVMAWVWGC